MGTLEAGGPDVEGGRRASRPSKAKRMYRKPAIKLLDPRAAVEKLRPLALAGDKDAQQWIKAISERKGADNGSR